MTIPADQTRSLHGVASLSKNPPAAQILENGGRGGGLLIVSADALQAKLRAQDS